MQPALLGRALLPPPASGAYVLSRRNGTGTWSAADAGKAAVVQLVVRDRVRPDIGPDLFVAPADERVELDQAIVRIKRLELDLLAGGRLAPTQPGDPCLLPGQGATQRLDPADVAARRPQIDSAAHAGHAMVVSAILHGVGSRENN